MRKITAVLLILALLTTMTVLALPAGAEAPAWVDLPEEVVAVTGGIPESLDGIPEQYDVSETVRVKDEVALSDALKNLVENGSCELPAPEDENWKPIENLIIAYRYDNGFITNPPLNVSIEDGKLLAAPFEPLTDDIVFFQLVLILPGDIRVIAEMECPDGKNGEKTFNNSVMLNYVIEAGTETYDYQVQYFETSTGLKNDYVVISQRGSDGASQRWGGLYSHDTGKLEDRFYYDFR